MPKVVVGSTNPVKIESVRHAFQKALGAENWSFTGVKAASGVPDQPLSDVQTLEGARNRARQARLLEPEADFWVGVEGGVDFFDGEVMQSFGWVFVQSRQGHSSARSATFPLPAGVSLRIRQGEELGPIIDELFDEQNSKQKGGAVGLLSNGLISREALYYQPMVFALLPFVQAHLYPGD